MVIGVKSIKNGQMCVSVDHCFVPRAELDQFATMASAFMQAAMPGYAQSPACTGIVSGPAPGPHRRHARRSGDTQRKNRDARNRWARWTAKSRQMPISLVLDPPEDLRIMREEIFGPLMPRHPLRPGG